MLFLMILDQLSFFLSEAAMGACFQKSKQLNAVSLFTDSAQILILVCEYIKLYYENYNMIPTEII